MTRIAMFPGQGSQKTGMGEDLFSRFPEMTAEASDILGYDIVEMCLEDPHSRLNLTQYTQPALYVVNALTWEARRTEGELLPDYAAGHSLGEYNALLLAGVFDFGTGLRLVQERGRLMGEAQGGGMAAVLGMAAARIREILDREGFEDVDLANLNSPEQTVISGLRERISQTVTPLKEAGARRVVPLTVSAAFHSRYMRPASEAYQAFLGGFSFADPQIPVIANTTAQPYAPGQTAELLARQIVEPVRWLDTLSLLLDQPEPEFVEMGPGSVLSGLLAKTRRASGRS